MRIDFKDGSHIEIILSGPGKIGIMLGAKSKNNPLEYIINSCEVSIEEFNTLLSDIPVDIFKVKKASNDEKNK